MEFLKIFNHFQCEVEVEVKVKVKIQVIGNGNFTIFQFFDSTFLGMELKKSDSIAGVLKFSQI
jgi:hypothetical protein